MNDIEVLRINYDRDGWEKITEGWTKHNVVSGSILAINSLCDEVEILRQQLAEAKLENEELRKAALKAQSAPASVWLWRNKTTFCVFATKELAMQMNSGGASTWVEPVEVPVIGNTALKESTEQPVAWECVNRVDKTIHLTRQPITSEFDDTLWKNTPLFATPPTATPPTAAALVEDFKRRAVEVCNNNQYEFTSKASMATVIQEIESLPLIEEKRND